MGKSLSQRTYFMYKGKNHMSGNNIGVIYHSAWALLEAKEKSPLDVTQANVEPFSSQFQG